MAELVYNREVNPWQIIRAVLQTACGSLLQQPAQVGVRSRQAPHQRDEGQRTLQKYLAVVGHCYELCWAHPDDTVHVRAFLGASFKAELEATNNKGNCNHSWPLLGPKNLRPRREEK